MWFEWCWGASPANTPASFPYQKICKITVLGVLLPLNLHQKKISKDLCKIFHEEPLEPPRQCLMLFPPPQNSKS